jgi:hypothetical protein
VNITQRFSTQGKEIKAFLYMEAQFSSLGISHTIFTIYKYKHGTWSGFAKKEAYASPQGSMLAKHSW